MKSKVLNRLFCGAAMSVMIAVEAVEFSDGGLTEEKVEEICRSNASWLVLDSFNQITPDFGTNEPSHLVVDLDGDGINDIAHGDMVAKVAELNDRDVITYGLDKTESGRYTDSSILAAYRDIISLIRSGEIEKPAAIVMSLAAIKGIKDIQAYASGLDGLTSENLFESRDGVTQSLLEDSLYYEYYAIFQELKELGVPVISAAGNNYSNDSYNFLGVLGAHLIGAYTYEGSEIAPYSNESSLTTIYRVGDFIARRVDDGVDINNDGRADFFEEQLSGGPSVVQQLRYRSDFGSDEMDPANLYKEGVFLLRDFLVSRGRVDPDHIPENLDVYGTYIHYPSGLILRKTEDGQFIFDPMDNSDTSQLSFARGTSFAAPNLCSGFSL